jgi:predicted hydrocarbon binding protein
VKRKREKLGDKARLSATILGAHLAWAQEQWPDALERLEAELDAERFLLVSRTIEETDWVGFADTMTVARAIARIAGGDPDATFYALGCRSAALNLAGAYRSFTPEEPHRFFETMAFLHGSFQNFGRSSYQKLDARSGRIRLEGYVEYSPVYCESGRGYYEEALRMMRAPGPVRASETSCQCAGDPACVYELSW